MSALFITETFIGDSKKENAKSFVAKKRKNSTKIFKIQKWQKKKIPKIKSHQTILSLSDGYSEKDTQSTISSQCYSPKKQTLVFDLKIPSFFNDTNMYSEFKKKFKDYTETLYQFDDDEDREVYLVRKESLF